MLARNYKILETNWRHEKGELDIITRVGNFLVVVEVKTRKSNLFGEPFTHLTEKQEQKIVETAEVYLELHAPDLELRFDIISIVLEPQVQLDHIEWAF